MDSYFIQDFSIGKDLKRLRNKAGYTQEQLAQELQKSGYTTMCREKISRMERGQYSIRISLLVELKKILKVKSYDEFFMNIEIPSDRNLPEE